MPSPKKCPSTKVFRRSHTRYTASGTVKIPAVCANRPRFSKSPVSRNRYATLPQKSPRKSPRKSPSRSPVRIKVRKGTLSKYGYKTVYTTSERRHALELAAENEGWLPIFRKLNAIAVFNKNRNPILHDLLIRDRDWVKKNFGY